jgi:hypothetical protein
MIAQNINAFQQAKFWNGMSGAITLHTAQHSHLAKIEKLSQFEIV